MTKALNHSLLVATLLFTTSATAVQGGIIEFYLDGRAGLGLLPGNELHVVNGDPPGTGGLLAGGIFYNLESNELTINVGWGSENGFLDLTGNATMAHIHGRISVDSDPFNTTAGVLYDLHTLDGWNPSASGGVIQSTLFIEEIDRAALFEGRTYINVHTGANGPGEIRGNLVVVPEPGETAILTGLGVLGLAAWRIRRRLKNRG